MAEELARKKRVRGGHRSSTTKMIAKTEEMLEATAARGTPDLPKLRQLEMSIKEKLSEIKTLDSEILALVNEEELDEEIAQADLYKERIYSTLIAIERASRPLPTAVAASAVALTDTGGTAPTVGSAPRNKVRLPKLTIKPFNGQLTMWTPFWDSFSSTIHENPELSSVDKFNYLRSLVTHSALEAISGLTLTGANYDEAVEVLRKRFGNKQLIINKHMECMLNTDGVSFQHDVKGLRRLYDVIESNVRSLKSLDVKAESYGSLLSSVLMNKLPPELRLVASRRFGDTDTWDFTALLKVIEEEVQARERSSLRSHQESRRPPKTQPTGATLLADTTLPWCCFCQQAHPSQDCQTIVGIEARREALRKTGRCYTCLGRGHVSRTCRSKIRCISCRGRHHVAICPDKLRTRALESNSSSAPRTATGLNPKAPSYGPPPTNTLWTYSGKQVLLQTARAAAFNPDRPSRTRRVRIVMDTGSQRSYITNRVRRELALTAAGAQRMTIVTFGATQGENRVCEYVRVGLKLKDGQCQILTLFSVPTICEPLASHAQVNCREMYSHLTELDFADEPEDADRLHVDILVGSDHYWDLTTGELKRGTDGPVAICTKLGWVLSGPIATSSQTDTFHGLVTHALQFGTQLSEKGSLDETMKSFWELESFGIPAVDRSLYDELCDTIVFRKGRYEVSLPWKTPKPDLPNNYELSLKRLKGLLRRLRHNPDILREYDTVIKTQLQQGIVEIVEEPATADNSGVHYLPHHAVIRRDKATTKLRIVYDASAKTDGLSLNDCLHPGPNFDQRILDILIRFRVHRVAITADIEKAFLMISVAPRDREFLRFLWVDNPFEEVSSVVVYRFTRVVFGVSSSPFLLNGTIRRHLELHSETHGDLIAKMLRSIYVDDVVTGAQSEEQAYKLYTEAKALLSTGAFNLRKFSSNSSSLQAAVDREETSHVGDCFKFSGTVETYSQFTLGGTQVLQDGEQKILGINWNVSSDQIVFSLGELAEQARRLEPTKRNVISLIGKFYDPFGMLAPIVVKFKVFMQSLCRTKIGWDDPIPETLMVEWSKLVSNLAESLTMTIPRCYLDGVEGEVVSYELCGYCDASLFAYAAVVYLLIEARNGVHTRFVVAKTRVAPLKKLSIPRLELLSAVLLARLMNATRSSLTSELEFSQYHCFTDSQVALCWIRNVGRAWKPFVQNRVSEIRNMLPVECWKHIPGVKNPADVPSRGAAPLDLLVNKLWREGPEIPIKQAVSEEQPDMDIPPECLEELRASEKQAVHGLLATETVGVDNLINVQNFSTLARLLSVLTYVLKFCSILRKTTPTAFNGNERKYAESLLISSAQVSLKSHKNFAMWERQLSLYTDVIGILRCRGRIDNALNLSYSTKYPVILPSDHHLTTLYVLRAHAKVLHNGVKETLTELRSRFWVIKGRSVVRKILHNCHVCRRCEGRPYRAPPPPPLPNFRVREAPPFTNTGVDFAGPLFVRDAGGAQSKVWIVLYTCCVTRAIHLDLVADMSAPTFIRSFKRFSSRRGLPTLMVSDNGKAFEAAAKVIKSVTSSPEVQSYFEGVEVKWKFNVPRAPWWGGVFERLVRSTKRCLRKALGRAKFSHDELLTVIVEIEMVLNSRPLTYISADDLEEPLTPSHLLVGRRLMSFPDHLLTASCDSEGEEEGPQLNHRLKHLNHALNMFWKRWRREYLLELREAHRHHCGSGQPQMSEGDVVVVYSEGHPRSYWKLGRIERVITGADGKKRAATVRVCKNGRTTTLERPIQHLYPLEILSRIDIEPERDKGAHNACTNEPTTEQIRVNPSQLRRSAASQARDRILAQAIAGWDE